jgi:CheY-like chemotaxis protein
MITIQTKHRYSYVTLDNESSYPYNDNKDHQLHYDSESFSHHLQNQGSNSDVSFIERLRINESLLSPKKILLVDDDPDISLAFKVGLEDNKSFEVYAYTDPLEALSIFKPHFYDLLLLDINMPKMNGFELCKRILEIDVNVRICFITAGDANIEALREVYPTLSIGCFIKKPVTIDCLVRRLQAELDCR